MRSGHARAIASAQARGRYQSPAIAATCGARAVLLRRRRRLSYADITNHGDAMLPDFRFLIGAVLATGMLSVAGFGLVTAVRLSHEARVGPSDSSQSLAFNDRADWNQFSDPELARRFELLGHQAEEIDAVLVPDTTPVPDAPTEASAPQPVVAPIPEDSQHGEQGAGVPAATAVVVVEQKTSDPEQNVALADELLTPAVTPTPSEPVVPAAAEIPDPSAVADTVAPAAIDSVAATANAEAADVATTAEAAEAPAAVEAPAAPKAAEIAAAPTTAEAATAEVTTPQALAPEAAAAPPTVEAITEPEPAIRIASTSAASQEEEVSPVARLFTPLPKPRPKMAARKRPKVKVARAARTAKPRPRPAAAKPAAASSSTGYTFPTANPNEPWNNGSFYGR